MATVVNFLLPLVLPMILALIMFILTAIILIFHYGFRRNRNAVETDEKKTDPESVSGLPPMVRSSDLAILPDLPFTPDPDMRISLALQAPRSPGTGPNPPIGFAEPDPEWMFLGYQSNL